VRGWSILMNTLSIGNPIVIADLIKALTPGSAMIDDLCLYTQEEIETITPETICYLDHYPIIINDKEIYSEFVTSNELELLYYGEQFNDVLSNIYNQKKTADTNIIIRALNYYMDNDDFLDID
jgi:hypothetical protein